MGFRQDAYAKVWKVENKGNYHEVQMSTSKKNKQTDQYETDFSSNFVRFIGTAHEQAKTLSDGDRIKIGNCETTNKYDKEKKVTYTNYLVFSYEMADGQNTGKSPKANSKPNTDKDGFMNTSDAMDEDLPFN
jgi:hypothetical protein